MSTVLIYISRESQEVVKYLKISCTTFTLRELIDCSMSPLFTILCKYTYFLGFG